MKLLRVTCVVWGLLCCFAGWNHAEDAPKKARMLMVTQSAGFKHGSVNREGKTLAPAEIAITQLGQQTGLFTVDCTQEADKDFTKENLQKYDLVFFYTTGKLPIAEKEWDYFFSDWMKQKGHGFIGAHSATDTYADFKPYWDFIGGTFNGHPWGSGNTVTISVNDTEHAASKPWGKEFQIKDEIYQYKNWQPEKVRVLMSLNMAKCNPSKPYMVPVSWVKQYGDGRMYYTNLGHNPETWANKTFLESMANGIRWVLYQAPGDATPNPEVSKSLEEKAQADAKNAPPEKPSGASFKAGGTAKEKKEKKKDK